MCLYLQLRDRSVAKDSDSLRQELQGKDGAEQFGTNSIKYAAFVKWPFPNLKKQKSVIQSLHHISQFKWFYKCRINYWIEPTRKCQFVLILSSRHWELMSMSPSMMPLPLGKVGDWFKHSFKCVRPRLAQWELFHCSFLHAHAENCI